MVDRYYLPIPKSGSFHNYVHHRNYKTYCFLMLLSVGLFSFQLARYNFLRQYQSKPAGYFVDWGSPDAPKKIKYFD